MQLKETGAGEVTVWLAELSATIGGTEEEEEAAQSKEREGTNNNARKRYPAIPHCHLVLSAYSTWLPNGSHYKWTVVSRADNAQGVGVLSTSH